MKIVTVPNALTVLRFGCAGYMFIGCLALFGVTLIGYYSPLVALTVFAVGSATDWFDGKIARAWPSQQSRLGEIIDPVADKVLLFGGILFVEASSWQNLYWYEHVGFAIVIFRELAMIITRCCGGPALFPVSVWGKRKACFQMIALTLYLVLLNVPLHPATYRGAVHYAAWIALCIAVPMTLYSMYEYAVQFVRKRRAKTA